MDEKSRLLGLLQDNLPRMRREFSVKRIALFGSRATGENSSGSDIDILVELAAPTFDHYFDLKFFLEELLSAPVDLVLADTIKPRLRREILAQALYA